MVSASFNPADPGDGDSPTLTLFWSEDLPPDLDLSTATLDIADQAGAIAAYGPNGNAFAMETNGWVGSGADWVFHPGESGLPEQSGHWGA